MKPHAQILARTAPMSVAILALAGCLCAQSIIYVDGHATGKNDGSSWTNAYTELRTALPATSKGEIWIAAGTYTPSASDPKASFQLKSGVALLGGFAGTETRRDERDPAAHPTVLSGDLAGNDGANWANMLDNAHHVVTATGTDATAVVDGVTITAGRAIQQSGGGIFLQNASAVLVDCTIRGNLGYQSHGAGIMLYGSGALALTRCTVKNNLMSYGRGGGLALSRGTAATLTECVFEANRVTGAGSTAGYGGAIYCDLQSDLVAHGCRFVGNIAEHVMGGSGYPSAGGAIESLADRLWLERCAFIGNRSQSGGAIHTYRTTVMRNCLFNRNRSVRLFDLGGIGGAVVVSANTGSVEVFGCTFYGNSAAEDGGGLMVVSSSGIRVTNSIFHENRDTFNQVGESQIKGARASHCCIQNLLVPRPNEDPPQASNFPGSIDADPRFRDVDGADDIPGTEDDDFRLIGSASPCIDAGDPSAAPVGGRDLGGHSRLLDGDLNGAMRIDMGAHEFANVELARTVTARPGGYHVEVDTSGTPGLGVVLAVGQPGSERALPPYGGVFVDLTRPFALLPLGSNPAKLRVLVPASTVPLAGIAFEVQALALGAHGGNVSNALELRIP